MSIIRKNQQAGLSEEAKHFARTSSSVPPEIREFLSRQHDSLHVQIEVYREVAMTANLKADALIAVRRLQVVQGDAEEFDRVVNERDAMKRKAEALEARESEAQRKIQQLTVQALGAGANVPGD